MLSKGFAAALALLPLISWAGEYSLTVDRVTIDTGDFSKQGIGYNGASPGPILRFREGEDVTIHVTNNIAKGSARCPQHAHAPSGSHRHI